MKGSVIVLFLFLLSPAALAQVSIPAGTILPIELSSSLEAGKSKPGQKLRARIMQDVPLAHNQEIKAGTKVLAEVLSANQAQRGSLPR